MTESQLVASILRTFGSRSGIRLWRQNTGVAQSKQGAVVRFGTPGQADISGLIAPDGQRIEIECKAATGRQSEAQKRWQRMIEKHGGLYVLARSVDDVTKALQ